MSEYNAELVKKAAARDERARLERAGLMERLAAGTALEGIIDVDNARTAVGPIRTLIRDDVTLRSDPNGSRTPGTGTAAETDLAADSMSANHSGGSQDASEQEKFGQRTYADWMDLTARIDRL
jgi:hypothetical protein